MELGEVSTFIGTNGSGKSNVLRALNLFFNGHVEGMEELDLRRDFHKPWSSVSNRFIEVEVRFQLPTDRKQFAIRKSLTAPLGAIGVTEGGDFWLRKRWTKDAVRENMVSVEVAHRPATAADYTILTGDGTVAAERFLQLTRFRYIPNHVHPSELIRSEHAALQEVLFRAVRRALTDFDSLLGTMAGATEEVVKPVTDILETAPGHFEGLEVTTPGDWAEVVWSLIPKLRTGGRGLDVALHGSGHQTALMYSLIYFLDTRFNEEFGWHQATIWAVEEPESFLHADLENWLARFFAERASRPRFQVLLTTHDLLFVAASDAAFEVTTDDFSTTVEKVDGMELADRALASGVTTFVHPLNRTAPKPTLLVDGPFDVYYLEASYRHSGRKSPWDIRCLETLDPTVGGSGKNTLKNYLKANRGPLRARPRESPVVVLLDWEDTEAERQSFSELVEAHPTSNHDQMARRCCESRPRGVVPWH